ncbi:hypothetical protein [Actinomadura welshii]|uniref:hypothetical protein n=1 Tax=Actinomadura welshii TaxID=3103817 RepID=UPI0003ACF04F|nr:hypothetical protein [Actinomadura madurae]
MSSGPSQHAAPATPTALTPSQTIGPLYGFALMFQDSHISAGPEDAEMIHVEGSVLDGEGRALTYPDAMIEAWHDRQWVRARTDQDGMFRFTVRKPQPLRTGDGRLHAPHLNVAVFAAGLLKQAMTRLYFPDERQANEQDPVLKRLPPQDRHRLVARRENDALRFDIHLQGDDAVPFFEF